MRLSPLQWRTFAVISAAHLVNDAGNNFLPQLLPFLLAAYGLSVSAGANLVAAFTITSSLLQPVFGYLVDQRDQRWLVFAGTFWMTALLGLTGLVSSYPLLLIIALLAGMGTAAFHPQAAAMVGQAAGSQRGFFLAAWIAMGNLGLAISPLLLLPLFHRYGLAATPAVAVAGLLTALFLYRFTPRPERAGRKAQGLDQALAALGRALPELSKLMLVVALRALTHNGVMTLLPLFLLSGRLPPALAGLILFVTLTTGAVGGLAGGYISDRYGRKPLIVGSMLLAALFYNGFLHTASLLSFILLALGSFALLSSFAVTVAASQEVIPENKALASGLSLGFAMGMGGLGVSLLGRFADAYGLFAAVQLTFLLPLGSGLIGLLLKPSSTQPLSEG